MRRGRSPSPAVLIENKAAHTFLDGVTTGVIGLIVVTTAGIVWSTRPAGGRALLLAGILFAIGLTVLYRWKSKAAVVVVVLGPGLAGLLTLLF